MPELFEPAPDFTLPATGHQNITLSDLRPSCVVLYFYPRDDTPGCTRESIGFSELAEDFRSLGAHVFGISKDSLKKHEKFATKHDIHVPLLSDEHGQTCEDYGVWKEKNMYGKTYTGIERTTFLIDGQGRISRLWSRVKVPGHAHEVLEAVRGL